MSAFQRAVLIAMLAVAMTGQRGFVWMLVVAVAVWAAVGWIRMMLNV